MQLRDDKPGIPAANQWGLFGGLSKPNEEPKSVTIREIEEELNIRLVTDKLCLLQKHFIPQQNLTTWVYFYPITDELNHAILREGQAWDYIGVNDLTTRISDCILGKLCTIIGRMMLKMNATFDC